MSKIKGCLSPIDGLMMAALLIGQQAEGIQGGVAEIGVYFGRSFFLMQRLVGDYSKLLAADLFDIGPHNSGPSDQLRDFARTAERLGMAINSSCVYVGNSAMLLPEQVLNIVGKCRFFHIDGGHEWEHVRNDAELALATLSDCGIIVFDDFFNPQWPDVSLSVFDFIRRHEELQALAITNKKLFVCMGNFVEKYSEIITNAELLRNLKKIKVNLFGRATICLYEPIPRRIMYELASRIGIGQITVPLY